jgi:putative ABC transport system ATP-binding protein
MGFVFQQPTMLKNLNLLDNIILPALHKGGKNVKAVTQKAKTLMDKAGISGLGKRDTAEVSGGQLQRAGICRALVNSPEILFADEPTGALNSKAAAGIMELLSEINKDGTAILLVTHDVKVAARAERVLFTMDGKVVSELSLHKSGEAGIEARADRITAQMTALGI